MTASLGFVVPGIPVGQGRISFYGKGRAVHSNHKTLLPWRECIAGAATTAADMQEWPLTDGPVCLAVTFRLPRPKSHYLKSGLRPNAPRLPSRRPDLDHLIRALLDGITLSGKVWADDSQVVSILATKFFTEHTPGVSVRLWPSGAGAG